MIVIVLVLVLIALVGGCAAIDAHTARIKTDTCTSEAKVLKVESLYKNGECLFLTTSGVWLVEQDYLMLCAAGQCP